MLTIILVFSIIVIELIYNYFWKRRNLPKGPAPLPFLGNKLDVDRFAPGYDAFIKWSKQYGPVYTYWLGESPVVAVTDFDLIEETFIRDADGYVGRAFLGEFYKTIIDGAEDSNGIIKNEGTSWQNLRRFSLQVLRNLGMGRSVIEHKILNEIRFLYKSIDNNLKDNIVVQDVTSQIDLAVGSVITQLTFGHSFHTPVEKEEFYELKRVVQEHMGSTTNVTVQTLIAMPSIRFLPVFSKAYSQFLSRVHFLHTYYDREILATKKEKERREAEGATDEYTHFVDAFLDKIENSRNTPFEKIFNHASLIDICQDLFIAGQDTSSNTLSFLVLYVMLNPETQNKMQAELDTVINESGNVIHEENEDSLITTADRNLLHYTNAVINETQRLCNLLPQNLIHKTTRDVIVGGHHIAKGTRIVPQISCVLYDERIFPNPHEFKPERFLDEEGKLIKCKQLVPFSVGKRQCLGESLAKMELLLFTANLFYKYRFTIPDQKNPPNLSKIPGLAVRASNFMCHVEKRIHNLM